MSLCSSLVPKPHPALAHLFETRTCILVQILVELHNEEECCHLMLLCPSLHHKLPALLWLQSDHLRQPCIESNGNKDPLINCMQEAYSHFLNLLKYILMRQGVRSILLSQHFTSELSYSDFRSLLFTKVKYSLGFFHTCNLLLEIIILCKQLQKRDLTINLFMYFLYLKDLQIICQLWIHEKYTNQFHTTPK